MCSLVVKLRVEIRRGFLLHEFSMPNGKISANLLNPLPLQIVTAWESVNENAPTVERWEWSRPDVHIYTLLIQGLAASLRVSDALRMIEIICRVGVSPAEEVRNHFSSDVYEHIRIWTFT